MLLSVRTLLTASSLALLASCAPKWGTNPSLELKINGGWVIGTDVTTRFTASPTPELVLSRTRRGQGYTAFFSLPTAPEPGTYTIVDAATASTASATPVVVGLVESGRVETRPSGSLYSIERGTMNIVSVAPDKIMGTFRTTIKANGDEPAKEFTGRFVAVN